MEATAVRGEIFREVAAVAWTDATYERLADHAWTMAMAILEDADAAANALVEAFRRHARADGHCDDLAVLTSVVRIARSSRPSGLPDA